MMKEHNAKKRFVLGSLAVASVLCGTCGISRTFATGSHRQLPRVDEQYPTNATFGYYQPRWRKWPTQRIPQRADMGEGTSPRIPRAILPAPAREDEGVRLGPNLPPAATDELPGEVEEAEGGITSPDRPTIVPEAPSNEEQPAPERGPVPFPQGPQTPQTNRPNVFVPPGIPGTTPGQTPAVPQTQPRSNTLREDPGLFPPPPDIFDVLTPGNVQQQDAPKIQEEAEQTVASSKSPTGRTRAVSLHASHVRDSAKNRSEVTFAEARDSHRHDAPTTRSHSGRRRNSLRREKPIAEIQRVSWVVEVPKNSESPRGRVEAAERPRRANALR